MKDGDRVLRLLSAPELVAVGAVSRLPGKLGGLIIGLSRELLAEIFEEDL